MVLENQLILDVLSDLTGWESLIVFSPREEVLQVTSAGAAPDDALLSCVLGVAARVKACAAKTGLGAPGLTIIESAARKVLFLEAARDGLALALSGRAEMNVALSRIKLIELVKELEKGGAR